MKPDLLYEYSGRDDVAIFFSFFFIFIPGGLVPGLPFMSIQAFLVGVGLFVVLALGMRCKIIVRPDSAEFVRTCYFIPYSGHLGQEITTVRFDGDWGDEEKSAGVVVTIDSVEVHICAKKQMVEVHDSLFRLSLEYKEMQARRELHGEVK